MGHAEQVNILNHRLHAELIRRHMDFAALSRQLQAIGVNLTAEMIERKLAEPDSSQTFAVQCFIALAAADPASASSN